MANYEAFRAMYEGRNAKLFNPATGVITWMSNPAQPSFVWQLYHHDLEPNSALFAVRIACEPVHIQLNEKLGTVQVINNLPTALTGAHAHLALYNLDGTVAGEHDYDVTAAPSCATDLGAVDWPAQLSAVHFVKLQLKDAGGKLVSDNFYWRAAPPNPDKLDVLATMPVVTMDSSIARHDADGNCLLDVTLHNPGKQIALMAHLQLRRQHSGERVLPVYYTNNYVSLVPGESKTITIEAAQSDLQDDAPLVVVDGWNVGVMPSSAPAASAGPNAGASVALNVDAQVDHWPTTGLPIVPSTYIDSASAQHAFKVNCGGGDAAGFDSDECFAGGHSGEVKPLSIDTSAPHAGPEDLYRSERWGACTYVFYLKPANAAYTVRLHFAETTYKVAGKRQFNVAINGQQVLTNFDPAQEAGAADKAVVKDFPGIMPDKNSAITVTLTKGAVDEPEINGIEIF